MKVSPFVRLLWLAALALPACGGEPLPQAARPEISAPAPAPAAAPTPDHAGWNATQIDWQPHEAGLARARAQNKPVCLVLYTDWCPHCRNYSHVFEDARIVERARAFVMIRANADDEPAVAGKYPSDGGYVPRTLFLRPDGTFAVEIHAPRPDYRYFFDEHEPLSLLAGMEEAVRKLAR